VPELAEAVNRGAVRVTVAAKVASLPPAQQQAALAGGKPAIKAAVKQATEQAKPDWAKGPTPQEEAKNDAGVRWHACLHKLYVLLNSVRDNGGIAELAAKWDKQARTDNAAELLKISVELQKWIRILEKGP